jgi:type IV secretion system protein VirD4
MSAAPAAPRARRSLSLELMRLSLWCALAWWLWPRGGAPEWRLWAGLAALFLAAGAAFDVIRESRRIGRALARRFQALRPGAEYGTGGVATDADIRRAGLHRPADAFVGLTGGGTPVFYSPVHAFVLAPAGKGKTVSFVTNRLCLCTDSIWAPDYNGELAVTTARLRRERHGQRVVILNAAELWADRLGPGDQINPLLLVAQDMAERPADALATTTVYVKQLCAAPPNAGNNLVFYQGAQDELAFAILKECATKGRNATLCDVARLIANPEAMDAALAEAMEMPGALGGELTDRALALADLRVNEPKLYNNCHVSAVQAMRPFSRAGLAARMVAGSTFDPIELKNSKTTVYVVIDPSRQAELAPVTGLITQYALLRLMRAGNTIPVRFLLDEGTNFKVENLSEALTGLRGFGIGVDFIAQSLSEVERVYGRHAVRTFVNQSDLKLFFGLADHETAEMVSRMIGSSGVATASYALGQTLMDDVGLSRAATARPALTPDELLRLPADRLIAFAGHHRAMNLRRLSYAEIDPFRHWVEANPLTGARLKARVAMRLKT